MRKTLFLYAKSLLYLLNKSKVKTIMALIAVTTQFALAAQLSARPTFYDSIQSKNNDSTVKPNIASNINLNSLGYFGYGGRIVSDKQSLDANIIYERPKWGALLYKVVDLFDHKSPNNFAMAMAFKRIEINDRIIITPYVGIVIEQIHSIADKDSDFGSIITSTLKLNHQLSVEHTTILSNLAITPQNKDWVNRIRVIYNSAHYDLTWLGWHNNSIFDNSSYYATGVSVAYKRITMNDDISLTTRITGYKMIKTSNMETAPIDNGLLLTIGLHID